MTVRADQFDAFFRELWGVDPFPWQRRLSRQVCAGHWPKFIDLPTASGKTACLEIAVFALAVQATLKPDERTIGRRIFFVVNRRVIVDEAHDRAKKIAKALGNAESGTTLHSVALALKDISGHNHEKVPPLDVAMLRGGIVRDNRWARSITQPTIITSTIDQVGSRLLFRGYGLRPEATPLHAALIAHDSTLLLDEAHISRPFVQTLEAIQRYRGEEWADEPIRTPFHFVQLTATPGEAKGEIFRLDSEDQKDEKLAARHDCPKVIQLHIADKAKGKKALDALAAEMASKAVELLDEEHRNIAVVVNRVATARKVYDLLAKLDSCENYLAIGRMRPLDRDELTTKIQDRIGGRRSDSEPKSDAKPMFVVATQCLEVGADFDFDAMLSECASLDALRQRFGRLNRQGREIEARGAIIMRADQIKTDEQFQKLEDKKEYDDPIYGNALGRTWNCLQRVSNDGAVDFGINAMNRSLANVKTERLLAPKLDAPVMLPAYVDVWAQTNPRPAVSPDVAILLHGPNRGEPDVNVCWREDLAWDDDVSFARNEEFWRQIVSLCPPSSPECMPVPIGVLRKWLFAKKVPKDADDERSDLLEGTIAGTEVEDPATPHSALVWRGLKESRFILSRDDIKPGDTIVLPVSAGGWDLFGHLPDHDRADIAEKAFPRSRGKVILRLFPDRLRTFPDDGELEPFLDWLNNPEQQLHRKDLLESLKRLASAVRENNPELALSLEYLTNEKYGLNYERYPDGKGVVLETRRRVEATIPDMDDGQDDASRVARHQPVMLLDHLKHVRDEVERALAHVPMPVNADTVSLAAELHDLGKADERFQALLINGDRHDARAQANLWAKSERIPSSIDARRLARKRAQLPNGFRHEMLSMQLVERLSGVILDDAEHRDLVLHLIAAHHGHARPFAPVVIDDDPPNVDLKPIGMNIDLSVHERRQSIAHQLDSGVAERFWSLTRRFGWWGLAYLEAILRLSDQAASAREEVEEENRPLANLRITECDIRKVIEDATPCATDCLTLSGLDGSNPLGFLAALGVLVVVNDALPNVRLYWRAEGGNWNPVLIGVPSNTNEFLDLIMAALASLSMNPFEIEKRMPFPAPEFRRIIESAPINRSERRFLDLLAAYGCDALVDGELFEDTMFRMVRSGDSAGQGFLHYALTVRQRTDRDALNRSLFNTWDYRDDCFSFRWDPVEDSNYALRWRDPAKEAKNTMIGANSLALEGLRLLPSLPGHRRLETAGFHRSGRKEYFSWPIWLSPLSIDLVRSLLLLDEIHQPQVSRNLLGAYGVVDVFRSRRFAPNQYYKNFAPGRSV